jgi:hypothetical protein
VDDPTWTIAANWQAQRALIERLHGLGVMADRSLAWLLDAHMDAGPKYGQWPADFEGFRDRPLPKPEPDSAEAALEAERERQGRERYEAVRDRLARRFGLLEPSRRRVTPDEMAAIRAELGIVDEIPA